LDAIEDAMPHARMGDAVDDVRSTSSPRSSPAEKCSPSPWMTTALTLSGRSSKNVSSPRMVSSSSALRFSGRARLNIAISPWPYAVSDGGKGMPKLAPEEASMTRPMTSPPMRVKDVPRPRDRVPTSHGSEDLVHVHAHRTRFANTPAERQD